MIAEQVHARLALDRIIFIPAGDPPHKPHDHLAPARHRLAMVQRAIQHHPAFSVSDIEIRSSRPSYTVDTVTAFKAIYPDAELFFLVGLDAFLDFPSWKQAAYLLTLCHFVVCSRPGASFVALASLPLLPPISLEDLRALDAGIRTRLDVQTAPDTYLYLLALPPCEISASQIRAALRHGQSVAHWLPPEVESYIIDHNLYQSTS